jgi:predicted GNAT family acetyltransferase
MDERILTNLSEHSLATAVKANLYAYYCVFARSPRAEFCDSTGVMRWHTHVAHPWYNGVLSTRSPANDEGPVIEDAISYFKLRKVPIFTWWQSPELESDPWAHQLMLHGFRHDGNTPGMAMDLAVLPSLIPQPDRLVIKLVDTPPMLNVWAQTFARGYGLPDSLATSAFDLFISLGQELPYRYYLAYVNGRPVAASMLFLGAGVAGIYCVATVEEARGQGIGAAVTLAPLLEARSLGYHAGTLQSSDMGYNVYRRIGFQKVCSIDHYFLTI